MKKVIFWRIFKTASNPVEGPKGYELCSRMHLKISSGNVALVPTGIGLRIPQEYGWRFIATIEGIQAELSIIDENYENEFCVFFTNQSQTSVFIEEGQVIGSIFFIKRVDVQMEEVEPPT